MNMKISVVYMFAMCVAFLEAAICNKEPDMSKLSLDADSLHDSFYQLPSMDNNLINTTYSSDYVAVHHAYMHGPKKCPTWDEIVKNYEGRLCPVYYVLNHDENRIPRSYVEARCSCKSPPISKDNAYDCTALTQYTKVLRRIGCDNDGVFIYRPKWEIAQIGCYSQLSVRQGATPPVSPP